MTKRAQVDGESFFTNVMMLVTRQSGGRLEVDLSEYGEVEGVFDVTFDPPLSRSDGFVFAANQKAVLTFREGVTDDDRDDDGDEDSDE